MITGDGIIKKCTTESARITTLAKFLQQGNVERWHDLKLHRFELQLNAENSHVGPYNYKAYSIVCPGAL